MSLYTDLGIEPDAPPPDIKSAHRRAVKRLHPDNGETGDREKFEIVQRAFMILSDPAKRQRYDETGQFDDQPDNRMAQMTAHIMGAFDQALAEIGAEFEHVDVIARTKSYLTMRRGQLIQSKDRLDQEIAQHLKLLGRVKFKGTGLNPISATLNERIRNLEANARNADQEATAMQASIAYLDFYGFDFTPRQSPEPTWTMRHFDVRNDWGGLR